MAFQPDDSAGAFSLQFDRHGAILSTQERKDLAKKRGICFRCGVRTHKKTAMLKKQPITNNKVHNGICLTCNPEKRPAHMKGGISDSSSDPDLFLSGTSVATSSNGAAILGGPKRDPKKKHHKNPRSKKKPSSVQSGEIDDDDSMEEEDIWEDRSNWDDRSSFSAKSSGSGGYFQESFIQDSGDSRLFQASFKHERGSRNLHDSITKPNNETFGESNEEEEHFQATRTRSRDDDHLFRTPTFSSTDDAWDVVKAMRDNSRDLDILLQKCNQLRSIGDNSAGALHEVIPIMARFRKDWRLQAAACGAIWGLAAEVDDKKSEAADAGCINSIISAMKDAPNAPTLLKWGCGALSSLSHGLGVREHLANAGAVEVVVSALREHSLYRGMLEWSCRALFNFIHVYPDEQFEEDDEDFKEEAKWANENYKQAKKIDAAAAVLYAMQQHKLHYASHEWAFKFLCCVADHDVIRDSESTATLQIMYEEEGILACTSNVKASKASSITSMELAIGLLSGLLELAENDKFACAQIDDNIQLIIESLQEFSSNAYIQERALFLLRNLSYYSNENKAVINFCGGMDIVLSAMRRHPSDPLIQEYGCWTLWICSASSETFSDSNQITLETKVVAKAMDDHSSNVNLQVAGCGVIGNFFMLVDTVPNFDSLLDSMLNAMSSFQNESALQKQVCETIYTICRKDKMRARSIVQRGGVRLVIKAMESFRKELNLQEVACRALAALSDIDISTTKTVIDEGGVESILLALEGYPQLCQQTLQALSLLFLCCTTEKPIANVRLFEAIVRVINQTNDHTEYYHAYEALRNLSLHAERYDGITFSVASSTDAIIRTASTMVDNKVLVLEALCALWALAESIHDCSAFETNALVAFLVNVIRTYRGDTGIEFDEEVQFHAFSVLVAVTKLQVNEFVAFGPQLVDCVLSIMYVCAQELSGDPSRYAKLLHVALEALLYLSELSSSEAAIVRLGGIVGIIDAMMVYHNVNEVQTVGCKLLARLSQDNLEVKLVIAETDGVDILISAMMVNPVNSELQKNSIDTLSHLSVDFESREFVAQQGGIMLISSAMRNLKEDRILQEKACDALCTLASDAHKDILLQSQAIPVVIDIMKYHRENHEVQLKGLLFLQNISMRDISFKRAIADAGGIGAVEIAVEEHLASSEILLKAFMTIWSLCVYDGCQDLVARSKCIPLLMNGMMANIDSEILQKQACGAICTLSSYPESKTLIQRHNGAEAITHAMRFHFGSECVQSEGCRALSSIAVNYTAKEVFKVSSAEIDAIVAALDFSPRSYKIISNGVMALKNLSVSPHNFGLIKKKSDEIMKVLNNLSQRRPSFASSYPSAQEHAISFLDRLNSS